MSEPQFIDCVCPHCGAEMSFLEDFAGMVQDCPSCLQNVVVPADGGGQAGKLPLPIATSRLTLRRFENRDWKDLLEVVSNEELFRYMDGEPSEEEQVLHWLEQDRELRLTPGVRFSLGVKLEAEDKLIGYAQLWFEDELRRQAGLEMVIGQPFQGKGYGTEATAGLLRFGFEGLHLHRMSAATDSRAAPCLRMLVKAGMRQEGEFVKNRWRKGEWTNTVSCALLAEEYAATPAKLTGPT
jgi:[ribosomal protein S5]-alanine N-acetyltransferase